MTVMNPFKTKEFKTLQAEWYKKISPSFTDIEDKNGDFTDHRSLSDLAQRIHFKIELIEITESYWDWACDALYEASFKSARDRQIWQLHTEGKTGSEISIIISLERTWVNRKIQRITRYIKAQEYPVRSVLPYIQSR